MMNAGALIAGKYRVIKKLGEGAMGSVWLAKNELTDREFAIKLLLPEAAEAPTALARFLREARVCGTLRHPSILEIYDAGEAPELGGAPFLVMERLDGAALDVVLRAQGALPPRLAIDIVAQISRGLELAHAKGIVHRDIKPANVFLHRPGSGTLEPKVLDFGISKIIGAKSPEIALTHSAAILGSPIYMSPEQMDATAGLDARSDVHALGVLLWELVTGRAPFSSTSYNLLVVEIMKGPRPKLRTAMPSASRELAAIIERAFAIDPRDRVPSAAKLADTLEAELAKMGGGVLGLRTAAVDVLGDLKLDSTTPPPGSGSTTVPLSIDERSKPSGEGRRLPRASATSFADTEIAVSSASPPLAPSAAAVSGVRDGGRAKPASAKLRVAGGVSLALAVAVGIAMVAMHRTPKSGEPATVHVPASVGVQTVAPSAVAPEPNEAATASAPPPVLLPANAASAKATPSATPPPPRPTPRRPSRPSAAASATAPPPRIDQSGL